jgi:uncharacterized protein YjbI with pentapeptide repeats
MAVILVSANQVPFRILKEQGADAWNRWREANPHRIMLDFASLSGADIAGVNLSEADLRRANLSGANLSGANLSGANLSGADLRKANLGDADLRRANLAEADLTEAALIEAHLNEATLDRADLTQAYLFGAHLVGASLTWANLTKVVLSWADLHEANLTKANLTKASLTRANLTKSNLTEANLTEADLTEANFTDADLRTANLVKANLTEANLTQADLSRADLREASLDSANLTEADLSGANLRTANFGFANLTQANLRGANLMWTDFSQADLRGANLRGANLERAALIETKLAEADLAECRIYGVSAWNLQLDKTEQTNLVITREDEPTITVDDLQVAQFVYLILNNQSIRSVIDTLTSKAVLILGRFTPERKIILDRLREELRKRDLVPILFDFEKPTNEDFTGTVRTLAGMCRFVIADITNPKSSPLELQATVPDYMIPFVPIIQEGEKPFAMFVDLWIRYRDWVLEPLEYRSEEDLIAVLDEAIVRPAEARHAELTLRKAQELVLRRTSDYRRQ